MCPCDKQCASPLCRSIYLLSSPEPFVFLSFSAFDWLECSCDTSFSTLFVLCLCLSLATLDKGRAANVQQNLLRLMLMRWLKIAAVTTSPMRINELRVQTFLSFVSTSRLFHRWFRVWNGQQVCGFDCVGLHLTSFRTSPVLRSATPFIVFHVCQGQSTVIAFDCSQSIQSVDCRWWLGYEVHRNDWLTVNECSW